MFRVGKCLSTQNRAGNRRPSLNLNFQGGSLDSRVTFSRTSNATLTGSDGLIQYAPHNLLTYSEQFDNAIWIKENSTVTANSTTAPDGTLTADTVTATLSSGRVYRTSPSITAGSTYTLSAWLKRKTGTGAVFFYAQAAGAFSDSLNVTDAWQLFSWSFSATTTSGVVRLPQLSAAGDEVYVWGAQLNVGSLQPYYPTTTAAYYGPRFDYDPITLACKGLLIEEQRVNLLTYSEQFDNAIWTKGGATVTANTVAAPDGTLTADSLIEDTATGVHRTIQSNLNPTAGALSFSVYAKANARNWLNILFYDTANRYCNFNLSGNGVLGSSSNATGTIISVGNGWYKCSISMTTTGGNSQIYLQLSTSDNVTGYTGNGTSGIYLWGAQLEAGAFATSYIPTVASQVTRTADNASMTGTNFSSWFNNAEGTLYGEVLFNTAAGSFQCPYSINDGTNSNRIQAYQNSSLTSVGFEVTTGLVSQASINVTVSNITTSAVKQAGAYQVNNVNTAANGASGTADTSATLSTYTQLLLGRNQTNSTPLNGTIKSISYYPRRLTNAELQAITA